MIELYDATILLSVGLTAVLGAIFAVATTFLGRSLERARRDEADAEQQAKAKSKAAIASIRETIEESSPSNLLSELRKQLKAAEKAERKLRRQIRFRRFTSGPHLLGVTESFVVPAAFFVLAVVLSAIAKARIDEPAGNSWFWWSASATALVFGLWRLYLTLREVERVGATSEDVSFKREVEAYKQAMAEREEETRPICEITCQEDAPITMEIGEERKLEFRAEVIKGRSIHDVVLRIFVPPGFSIIEPQSDLVPDVQGAAYRGWTRASVIEEKSIPSGSFYQRYVTVRAAPEEGTYKIGYALSSEEYNFNTTEHPESELVIEVKSK